MPTETCSAATEPIPQDVDDTQVLLVQTTIGDYRQHVLNELLNRWGGSFKILCGREYFTPSVKTGVQCGEALTFVNNHFLLGRKALYQSGILTRAVQSRSVILEYNPRILTTWLTLGLRKLCGRRSVIWGHAWSRQGADNRSRRWMRSLADVIIVYTEQQRRELEPHVPQRILVIAAPNALYRKQDMTVAGDLDSRQNFIYVGRLVAEKKPHLLLEAFHRALPNLPRACQLLIVGAGPQQESLTEKVQQYQIHDRVKLLGHISDWATLKQIYGSALASVSPGYVGLSITQSFSFGIPMIISRDEPHAPEIEAAVEGENCSYFVTDDADSLAEEMIKTQQTREVWIARAAEIVRECQEKYSVELMASRIQEAVRHAEALSVSR